MWQYSSKAHCKWRTDCMWHSQQKISATFAVCVAYLSGNVYRTRLLLHSPAATAEHITKNIPTAILFREEGSRPRRFRMGSTTLSLRGISIRMSTASNMVSQAAGKRNVIWGIQRREMR